MSLIRINPPGQPIRYIDQGPCRASLPGFYGGPIEPITRSVTVVRNRVKAYQSRPTDVARCGAWMANAREHCWRRPGHVDNHRTRQGVELDNRRRRARDFG